MHNRSQIVLRGILGVVRKSRGSSHSYFMTHFWNSFEGIDEVTPSQPVLIFAQYLLSSLSGARIQIIILISDLFLDFK